MSYCSAEGRLSNSRGGRGGGARSSSACTATARFSCGLLLFFHVFFVCDASSSSSWPRRLDAAAVVAPPLPLPPRPRLPPPPPPPLAPAIQFCTAPSVDPEAPSTRCEYKGAVRGGKTICCRRGKIRKAKSWFQAHVPRSALWWKAMMQIPLDLGTVILTANKNGFCSLDSIVTSDLPSKTTTRDAPGTHRLKKTSRSASNAAIGGGDRSCAPKSLKAS
mmetsp:Transcript_33725/g.60884  ORF Transcript_33725/g.60884 Transcript_33725/m.60884 type:complete len:219 (-) Transcript_33725:648-1304(-)